MDCPETKKNLSDFLDDRLSPEAAEEVSAHLADCTACRAELAEMRRIDALLGGLADPPVDAERLDPIWSRVQTRLDDPEAADTPAAVALGATPFVVAPRPATQPRWMVPTLSVVGVATIAVTVFAVILLLRSPSRENERREVASKAADTMGATMGSAMDTMMSMASGRAMDAMGSDAMDAMGVDAMNAMGAAMTAGMDAMDSGSNAMGSEAMSTAGRRRRRRRGSSAGRVMSSGRTMSSGSAAMTSMSSGSSSLQDLLRRAGGSMSSSGASSAGASNAGKRLSPGQIRIGVGRIMGAARACGHRYKVPGTCRVRVVIRGSTGRVSGVSILGTFRGTPTGRCVARAFRRARFARFKNASQSFIFPVVFR